MPPSSPNPPRMYRSIGIQAVPASSPKQPHVPAVPSGSRASGVEESNTSQLDGESSIEQHPWTRTADGIRESVLEEENAGGRWPTAGRIFSLPPYLRDEALQQRMIAEGAVDDREEPSVERRVVSSSPSFRRQQHTMYDAQPTVEPDDTFTFTETCTATFEATADASGSSLKSTASRLTVLVHESTSINGEPQTPGTFFVDRSAGSTPESIIIISDRDSGLIQPGSFLRSRAPSPAEVYQVRAVAGTEGPPAGTVTDSRSHVSHSSQVDIVEVLEQLTLSDESEEDDVAPGSEEWNVTPPRPIPALHGPSSLPYARCPSGAEGEIFYNPQSVRDLVWNMDLQTSIREPPYLHPDYVAIVEYTEQSASKEESEVIVLVDSSLPTQHPTPRGGRSRSTFPQLPTPVSGQIAPLSETRRANEWRAQPVRTHNVAHARRERPATNANEEPPSPDFESAGMTLPSSNSNSSLGSGYTAPFQTPMIGDDIPVHVEVPTSAFDPHVASEQQLRHYFIEREQRRLYLEEQYLRLELDERCRRLSFESDEVSDFSQRGSLKGPKVNTWIPLTTEHLNLYRNLLASLDNQRRAGLNDLPASNGPVNRYSLHNPIFPSLLTAETLGSVPSSLPTTRSEDTHPTPSSIFPEPIAPYTSDSYNLSPELNVHPVLPPPNYHQCSRGFGVGYLFPTGSVAAYALPADSSIQNRWEGTPNASFPASSMYYRDTDSANASLGLQEPHLCDPPSSQVAPTHGSTGRDPLHPHQSTPQTFAASEDAVTQPNTGDSTDLQPFQLPRFARRVSQSRSQFLQQDTNREAFDKVQDHINDLDVPTVSTRPRSSTLSSMTTARGHRASTVRSLDLGKQQIESGTLTTASSSSISRVGAPNSHRTSSLASEYWRTPATTPSSGAIIPVDQSTKRWHTDRRPPIDISKGPDLFDSRVLSQSPVKAKEYDLPPYQKPAWRSAAAATTRVGGERAKSIRRAQVEMVSRGSGK
ncbi:hypothetical protein FRB93_004256 [Tulasnella sp. JGI-2019a]|nr:hypothetical protein FRB93_004256 [Tulasnella sp. JGI-2019a]